MIVMHKIEMGKALSCHNYHLLCILQSRVKNYEKIGTGKINLGITREVYWRVLETDHGWYITRLLDSFLLCGFEQLWSIFNGDDVHVVLCACSVLLLCPLGIVYIWIGIPLSRQRGTSTFNMNCNQRYCLVWATAEKQGNESPYRPCNLQLGN